MRKKQTRGSSSSKLAQQALTQIWIPSAPHARRGDKSLLQHFFCTDTENNITEKSKIHVRYDTMQNWRCQNKNPGYPTTGGALLKSARTSESDGVVPSAPEWPRRSSNEDANALACGTSQKRPPSEHPRLASTSAQRLWYGASLRPGEETDKRVRLLWQTSANLTSKHNQLGTLTVTYQHWINTLLAASSGRQSCSINLCTPSVRFRVCTEETREWWLQQRQIEGPCQNARQQNAQRQHECCTCSTLRELATEEENSFLRPLASNFRGPWSFRRAEPSPCRGVSVPKGEMSWSSTNLRLAKVSKVKNFLNSLITLKPLWWASRNSELCCNTQFLYTSPVWIRMEFLFLPVCRVLICAFPTFGSWPFGLTSLPVRYPIPRSLGHGRRRLTDRQAFSLGVKDVYPACVMKHLYERCVIVIHILKDTLLG